MPDDYRVHPLRVVPGEIPRGGQVCDYHYKNGDLGTLWIAQHGTVEGHPDLHWVSGFLIKNGNKNEDATTLVSDPPAMDRDAWRYDVAGGFAFWCPCTPPDPHHPCP